jgi:sphingosine kinase
VKDLKLLVYFNPAAGSNSKQQLDRFKSFMFLTNFQLEVITTQGKNHCQEHIGTVDAGQYHGVVIVSGDGLMHEFVNSSACGKLPVCHVPAGSGNAFSKTQTQAAGEICSTEIAAFLAVKGRTKVFNLWKVELEKEEPVYSFLSVEWAFLADIDINS